MAEQSQFEQLSLEIDTLRKRQDEVQAQLKRISEITVGIIYTLDCDGNFTFVNNAVEDILHIEARELIGKHFSTIMSRAEYERVSREALLPKFKGVVTGNEKAPKLFDERRTGPRRTRNLEVQLLTKEQREVKVFLGDVAGIIAVEGYYDRNSANKTLDKHENSFLGSQGIIFDITGFNITERDKYLLQKRLFEVQKMDTLGRFAGKIAHEFNNKLSAIIGCAEMLNMQIGPENKGLLPYIEPILSASCRASELSNKLFDFSKKSKYKNVTTNFHNIISNVIEHVKHAVGGRICIQEELEAPPHTMTANPIRIHSALINLAMNACNAMSGIYGTLILKTALKECTENDKSELPHLKYPGSYLCLSVNDNGKGMESDIVQRLLDNFYTFNIFGNGIGMGLANTFACIRDLGGFIEIASIPNQGTTFNVYVPLKRNDIYGEKIIRGTGEIVLIDNDESVAVTAKQTLRELGYTVISFVDGCEAIENIRLRQHNNQYKPDLVLLDMMLPKFSGGECLMKIKELYPSIKTIIYTGYSLSEEAESIINIGVNGFIYKPFTREHLSQVVANIITRV
jgi:PAS domain S-box-containing protein